MNDVATKGSQELLRRPGQMGMGLFGLLVALLLLANIGVFFYTPLRDAILGPQKVPLLEELTRQRDRLVELLREACSSPAFDRFRRGEFGPAPAGAGDGAAAPASAASPPIAVAGPSPTVPAPAPAQDLSSAEFRARLANQTVRVIAGEASGSGFFIGNNVVVTNRHVIEGAALSEVLVTSQSIGERPIRAKVVAATAASDIAQPDFALLQLERVPQTVAVAEIAKNPGPLDEVVAAGFPGRTIMSDDNALSPATVFSRGVVSVIQQRRDGAGLVIHTADIAPGSSGGPLVNKCGQIVGVNTFVNAGETPALDGRALYALSSETLEKFLKSTNHPFVAAKGPCAPASQR